jgi:hypothetical protein
VSRVFVGGGLLAGLPFLLSVLLARVAPVGRIVPVIDIHTATVALLFVTFPYYDNLQFFIYALFTFMGGSIGSQYGSSFLGYPLDPDEVEVRAMHVWMDWKQLKEVLEEPDIGSNFGLDLTRTEVIGNGVIFMRKKAYALQFFMRVVEHIKGAECIVYIFGFVQGKY